MLIVADATDPTATVGAIAAATGAASRRAGPRTDGAAGLAGAKRRAFELRVQRRYNPAGETRRNIVPGLIGTILTMTMLIYTALSVTREIERGTMETLLAMPVQPIEIMLGKILPYVVVGAVQMAIVLIVATLLFHVPIVGSLVTLIPLTLLFIIANLVDRLHILDHRQQSAAGDPDDLLLLPAEHAAVRLSVSVSRHAGLGAISRLESCRSPIICASCAR